MKVWKLLSGYGDFYPHTVAGKCLGIVVYIFGIGLISITISKVVDALFVYQRMKEEGKLKFAGENHFVIIDWSQHAENAINETLNSDPLMEIVLIDTLEKSPILLQKGATLISDGEPLNINKRLHEEIPPGAKLFVICDKETYGRLTRK